MHSERSLGRYKLITSNEIRDILFHETLTRIYMYLEYGDIDILDDSYQSLMFLGPPGVGKSALQKIAAKDVALFLSEKRGTKIEVKKISMRISNEDAVKVAGEVVEGKVIPYVHLYLPQTKIWHLEGTPSPMDNYVEVMGVKIPVNLWRLDAYLIPLLDYTERIKDKNRIVPAFLVLDEFNMARKDVLNALFQLARSAELGRAKFNPFTMISLIGNTPETNINAARQLAAPLIDRSQNYIVAKPDVSGWLAYMNEVYGTKWAQEIGAYLMLSKDQLYRQDESDPSIIQTPRGWTQIAVRMYVLKKMLASKIITKDQYWRHLERVVYSTLINETADELITFLRGIHFTSVQEIIEHPEKLKELDRNVAAYMVVKATSLLANNYVFEKGSKKKEILEKVAEILNHATPVLGSEALSLVLTSLPAPMRLSLSRHVSREVVYMASKTRKMAEELEELLNA